MDDIWSALAQQGWIDRAGARAAGVSDDALSTMVRRRQLRRLRAGLFVAVDATDADVHRAVVGDGGPGAVLGRASALWWWQLTDTAPSPVVVHVTTDRCRASNEVVRYVRTAHLCDVCCTTRRGIGSVRLERAVVDTAVAERGRSGDALVTRSVQLGRTSPARLVSMADHLDIRAAALRELLDHVRAGSRSAPEVDFIRVVRRFRLPMPQRDVPMLCTDGVTRYADLAYPEHGYYVEIDGRICHFAVDDWERDLSRMNEISIACDLKPLRFTSRQLRTEPARAASQVRRAIAAAGSRSA